MFRKTLTTAISTMALGVMLTGCMPKMTLEEMKEMMPQRPVELDKLKQFEGTWESTNVMTFSMLDEPLTGTGTSTMTWENDGWNLLERGTYTSEMGTMHGMGVWSWDAKAKKYRITWFDSMGSIGGGTSKFNEKTNTWHMKAKSSSSFGDSVGEGTMKFTDPDTMEWTWAEWDSLKLMKIMDMKGTAKRK